jgi:hypothetical protein
MTASIGCPTCTGNQVPTTEEFVDRAKRIHGDKYNYSQTVYTKLHGKIIVVCELHGIFTPTASNHTHLKSGCPSCEKIIKRGTRAAQQRSMTTEEFIIKCIETHGDKYDYSKTIYTGRHKDCIVICKMHGEFNVRSNNHLTNGSRCPNCHISKGEEKIQNWLGMHNISYMAEYRFQDCRDKYPLPFDFYFPELNICLEYDGAQHDYNVFKTTHTAYEAYKLHDITKTEYCKNKNIQLFRIHHTDFYRVESILADLFETTTLL